MPILAYDGVASAVPQLAATLKRPATFAAVVYRRRENGILGIWDLMGNKRNGYAMGTVGSLENNALFSGGGLYCEPGTNARMIIDDGSNSPTEILFACVVRTQTHPSAGTYRGIVGGRFNTDNNQKISLLHLGSGIRGTDGSLEIGMRVSGTYYGWTTVAGRSLMRRPHSIVCTYSAGSGPYIWCDGEEMATTQTLGSGTPTPPEVTRTWCLGHSYSNDIDSSSFGGWINHAFLMNRADVHVAKSLARDYFGTIYAFAN